MPNRRSQTSDAEVGCYWMRYDWIIKTYITPTLDKVPLGRLRAAQLDRFYAKLRDEGRQDGKPLSAATVRQVHGEVPTLGR